MDNCWSIAGEATGIYKEKGSKFIAYAYPVSDEGEVKERLEELKKQHYSARHHCYAYLIGQADEKCKAYDDGEPRHSAGDPILNQIRSAGLKDVMVIVVRYFGGTKLGKKGLINAYKSAAREALSNALVVEKVQRKTFYLHFKYEELNELIHILERCGCRILNQDYTEDCTLTCELPDTSVPEFLNSLDRLQAVRHIEPLPGGSAADQASEIDGVDE